jgi:outer membrane protein OmpA-like peptidoglycan-associated protein
LSGDVTVPTGGDAFMTDGGATFLPRLIADYRDGAGFVVALNAGYRMRPAVAVDDLVIDDELRFGLGAEVPVGAFGLAFVAEANVGLGLGDSAYDEGGIASREVQAEGLGGLRWRSTGGWVVSAAAGSGMSQGYGAADFRVLFGVTWNAAVASPIGEPLVAAVKNANRDPWREEVKVPVVPPAAGAPVPSEVFDAIVLADPDTDADGIMIPADQCPDDPEDRDGFQDEDGCPDPDNDGDGILDAADKCPDAKEVFNGFEDDDGCPDEGAPILTKDGDMLKIPDRIRFKSGSAELLPSDKLILDPVAVVLKGGGFGRLRIEGHTDNLGDREFNVDLAERRAWSVRSYLIEQGVDGERLFAKGFGPTRPIGSNTTEQGRAQNRRVEFHMVKPGEPVEGIIR